MSPLVAGQAVFASALHCGYDAPRAAPSSHFGRAGDMKHARCRYAVCACPPAELATLADTAEALPPGWERDETDPGCERYGPFYMYDGRSLVFERKRDGRWIERAHCTDHPSMLTAFAAALGYRIEPAQLRDCIAYRFYRDGGSSALYRTADEAAHAACEAHGHE